MAEPLGALAKVAALAHLRAQRGAGAVAAEQGGERVRVRFAIAAAGDGACVEIDRFQSAVEVQDGARGFGGVDQRSEEHTSELQSLMRSSSAVFCLQKKTETD